MKTLIPPTNPINSFKTISKTLMALCFIFCAFVNARAQTLVSSININSSQQTFPPPANFNNWIVTAMTPQMQVATCFAGNTVAPPNPPVINNPNTLNPVALNSSADIINNDGQFTYLSCFQTNTLYTPWVQQGQANTTAYQMTISRQFQICSNNNEQVNFNFTIKCDDGITSVLLDGNAANPLLVGAPMAAINPVPVVAQRLLAPGLHTISIQCYDWQNPNGSPVTVNGVATQWNPFVVGINNGTITCANNVLLNAPNLAITPITGNASSLCAGANITLANATAGGTWSSSNTGVATINQAGLVTGVAPGNATISYSILQGACSATATYPITVTVCHCEDSCSWSLTGNTFVKPWNFIGSLNNADFKIRTNNTEKMIVTAGGNVGINTSAPAKLLEVNGEARIGNLPASAVNERIVFANTSGDLHSLLTTGNTSQYLSGDGTWQNLVIGGGNVNADQGLTVFKNTVLLGDLCNRGGGLFQQSREINMNNLNLYFNSSREGKLYMGRTDNGDRDCRNLFTRLEISSEGLPAANDYSSPGPSTSGLRFTNLTVKTDPIDNQSGGVLSLDADGDVIWVKACCTGLGLTGQKQLANITDRLTKLENELKESKAQAAAVKAQLAQMDIVLAKTNTVVLNQNVPNPFAENTTITYAIPDGFSKAQIIFSTTTGEVVKIADIRSAGKGQINVFANDISSGVYIYTLVIDGKKTDSKRMVKQ